jgi:phosphatidate phosphatase APP1
MSNDTTSNWRQRFEQLATGIFNEVERVGHAIGVGRPAPYELVAYRGYGHGTRVLVHGRALEAPGVSRAMEADGAWRNLINTVKRIDADPLAGARVEARVGGATTELVADDEGFFRAWIDLPAPLPTDAPWQPVELRLLSPVRPDQSEVRAAGRVRVLTGTPTLGVISDLDDTVIQSRITSFFQAVRTVMLGNARTRLPFPGVAAFYRALEAGADGTRRNPIFYVSSSPWNIHDVIADFMEIQRIPEGPIQLRDWDIGLMALRSSRHQGFKEPVIREVLDLYAELPFILIGDNSQHDPEIYRAILDRYPGRILAIYIRNVRVDPERSAALQALAKEVLAAGSTLVVADDTYAAATHAAERGWIAASALAEVREEKRDDERGGEAAKTPTIVVGE